MEKLWDLKQWALAVLAALGGLLANALGGWDATLQVLVGLMAVDYATGTLVALVFRRSDKTASGAYESRAGFKGLARKCAVLALVFVGALLDQVVGQRFVRSAVCLFFIANEGLSVLENLGHMGVERPAFLQRMLEAMRKRNSEGDDGDDQRG